MLILLKTNMRPTDVVLGHYVQYAEWLSKLSYDLRIASRRISAR